LLRLLYLLRLADDISPKSARLAGVLAGLGPLRASWPITARFGAPASVATAVRCALRAGLASSGTAPVAVILRHGRGGNGKGKRQRQGCQRSTLCKNRHHPRDSKSCRPTTSGVLRIG
jgi:hypothetical protein